MSNYLQIIADALPAVTSMKAAAQVSNGTALVSLGASAAGGYAGYRMWKKHPVLGALIGLEAGQGVLLVKGSNDDRLRAVSRMVGTGVGVVVSTRWKRHPALGFIIGLLGGDFMTSVMIEKKPTRINGDDSNNSAVARLLTAMGPMAEEDSLT